jgi:CheY-like chemotaxis protein
MSNTILFIEDDEDDIAILQDGFDELGFKDVTFCIDVLSAISHLNALTDENLPKLIVTDYNLPIITGYQFVEYLRNNDRFSNIKLAVFSTSLSQKDIEKFSKVGVTTLLEKPSSYNEFKVISSVFKSIVQEDN